MFVTRRRGPSPHHLEWRIRVFGVGAILGLVGIAADASWMVWIALAVLVAGFFLRFLGSGEAPAQDDKSSDGDDSDG